MITSSTLRRSRKRKAAFEYRPPSIGTQAARNGSASGVPSRPATHVVTRSRIHRDGTRVEPPNLLGRRPITTRQLRRADQVDLARYGLRRALRSRPIMHEQVFREPDYSVRGVGSGPPGAGRTPTRRGARDRRRVGTCRQVAVWASRCVRGRAGFATATPTTVSQTRCLPFRHAVSGCPPCSAYATAVSGPLWPSSGFVTRVLVVRSQTRRAVPTGAGHGGQPVADTSDQHLWAHDIAAGASSYKRFADLASLSEFQTCKAMSSSPSASLSYWCPR
jgi:hypothetical protein